MVLDPDDAFIAAALARAAEQVRPQEGDKSFLEKRLAEAFATSLADGYFRPELVVRDKKLQGSHLPGWDPQPGTIDVAIITPATEPRIVFELNVDDVEWTLWDIYKMVAATELPTVEAAYLVVAGPPKLWTSQRDCVELFDLDYSATEQVDSVDWYSRFLFSEYRRAWAELLEGGTGRIQRVPEAIVISALGRWPLPGYPAYELRAIRVWPSHVKDGRLNFADEWPAPPPPPPEPQYDWSPRIIPTAALTLSDLPTADAPERAYHHFALSYNGYEEMGTTRRCGRIANQSIQRWRETRKLPPTIEEVRACLFFEQRRWHHYGYGFDEETLTYLRELVAELGNLLEARHAPG